MRKMSENNSSMYDFLGHKSMINVFSRSTNTQVNTVIILECMYVLTYTSSFNTDMNIFSIYIYIYIYIYISVCVCVCVSENTFLLHYLLLHHESNK